MTTSRWTETSHSIQHLPYWHDDDERAPLLQTHRNPHLLGCFSALFLMVFLAIGLATGIYLLLIENMQFNAVTENYSLITRRDWRARETYVNLSKLILPAEEVFLATTNTRQCEEEAECVKEMIRLQNKRSNEGKEHIGYNFVIGGDGQTYEGIGWHYRVFPDRNSTLVVAFLGIFDNSLPTYKQMSQARSFLEYAQRKNKLEECYKIRSDEDESGFSNVVTDFRQHLRLRHGFCFGT